MHTLIYIYRKEWERLHAVVVDNAGISCVCTFSYYANGSAAAWPSWAEGVTSVSLGQTSARTALTFALPHSTQFPSHSLSHRLLLYASTQYIYVRTFTQTLLLCFQLPRCSLPQARDLFFSLLALLLLCWNTSRYILLHWSSLFIVNFFFFLFFFILLYLYILLFFLFSRLLPPCFSC